MWSLLVTILVCVYGQFVDALSKAAAASPLKNATHYWNLKEIISEEGSEISFDLIKKTKARFVNNVMVGKHDQLGNVLKLDGQDGWVVVPKLLDKCLTRVSCPKGITMSFWMKYEGGDYVLAAGRYVVDGESPGFRLQKDPESNFFLLEVSNTESMWQIYIKELPTDWFHFLFTWKQSVSDKTMSFANPNEGLKVYINGELKLSKYFAEPKPMHKYESVREKDDHKLTFGRISPLKEMKNAGKFQFGHLAIWRKALSDDEVEKAFRVNINWKQRNKYCCFEKNNGCTEYDKHLDCICPDIKKKPECTKPKTENKVCKNVNPHCDKLTSFGQEGYCSNFPEAFSECKSSCACERICRKLNPICDPQAGQKGQKGHCKNNYPKQDFPECYSSCRCEKASMFLASRQPKKHFSQEAVIFAILGCVGGLVLLFGIMFYFWKVYRTRYHGAFVPPLKSVSLLDVPEYEDEKWPSKYVDSSAFYIKDVPPKRRALPLIPAKNSQSNYRYQPPEFD